MLCWHQQPTQHVPSLLLTPQAVALGAAVQAGIYEGEVGSLVCFAHVLVACCCHAALLQWLALQAGAYLPMSHPRRPPMPLLPHHPKPQVSELMVMDVWQATLMRAFATKLAQEQGELGEADEEWPASGGSDDEGWEWPDDEAAAAAAEEDDDAAAAGGAA